MMRFLTQELKFVPDLSDALIKTDLPRCTGLSHAYVRLGTECLSNSIDLDLKNWYDAIFNPRFIANLLPEFYVSSSKNRIIHLYQPLSCMRFFWDRGILSNFVAFCPILRHFVPISGILSQFGLKMGQNATDGDRMPLTGTECHKMRQNATIPKKNHMQK